MGKFLKLSETLLKRANCNVLNLQADERVSERDFEK